MFKGLEQEKRPWAGQSPGHLLTAPSIAGSMCGSDQRICDDPFRRSLIGGGNMLKKKEVKKALKKAVKKARDTEKKVVKKVAKKTKAIEKRVSKKVAATAKTVKKKIGM
jgi:hypothetical protein